MARLTMFLRRHRQLMTALMSASVSVACVLLPARPIPPAGPGADFNDQFMIDRKFRIMMDGPEKIASFGPIQRIYVTGKGPKVILLHELPGLRDADVQLGTDLGNDFEVHMPLMFGTAGQDNNSLGNRQACKTKELFRCSDRNAQHPIVKPLTEMTEQICRGTKCGVIGMCLTGTFPLRLAPVDGVVALVMAQPTLPFFHIWPFNDLDISAAETQAAMEIAARRRASVYLTRYRHDLVSGHSAFNVLVKRIQPFANRLAYFEHREVKGHKHSTLVREGNTVEEAEMQLRAIRAALNAALRSGV